ncbi:hypothetical protein LCGC14_1510810 [marine sediment metagenome]|uniref:Uncharacterized protein n=1 Tax=marine sediment metagenome TaxID=412755 RepID=A0A0F9LGU8_9ZZZZ
MVSKPQLKHQRSHLVKDLEHNNVLMSFYVRITSDKFFSCLLHQDHSHLNDLYECL